MHALTPLMCAASTGKLEMVRYLLDHGAQVNARTGSATALIWGASSGNVPTDRLLLARGADAGIQTEAGTTALSSAREHQHLQVVKLLQEYGATE